MLRTLFIVAVLCIIPEFARAQVIRSSRSAFTIRSVDVAGQSIAIVSLGSGQPNLTFRFSGGQIAAVRIPPGLIFEVSWEVSDAPPASTTLRIRRGGASESRALLDVVVVSGDHGIAFADQDRFEKIVEMDSLRDAMDVFTEQFVKDLTDEEDGEPGATDNPDGAQRLREDH